jgi:hypothetical protein
MPTFRRIEDIQAWQKAREPAFRSWQVEDSRGACKNRVTLKPLANDTPGFALKPWVQKCPERLFATLKGVALLCG